LVIWNLFRILVGYKLIFSYPQALSISACINSMGGLEGWFEMVSNP